MVVLLVTSLQIFVFYRQVLAIISEKASSGLGGHHVCSYCSIFMLCVFLFFHLSLRQSIFYIVKWL